MINVVSMSVCIRTVFVLLLVVTTWSIAHGVDDEHDPTEACGADGTGTCDSNGCVDKNPRCLFWAEVGECVNNPRFMTKSCPQSCEVCIGDTWLFPWESGDDCGDSEPKCELWQKEGECTKNPNFMKRACKLSCRKCVNVHKLREAGANDFEM